MTVNVQELDVLLTAKEGPVEFKEANCTVNVVFLDVPRMSSDGAPDPVGGIFRHDGGVLQHVEIEVSLASLGMLDPGAVYANRHARQTLVRNVSNVVALWSIGFRGIPNLEPAYVDRQGNRLPIAQALSILHYDKSVKAGASAKDGMAQAEGLAEAVLDGTYAAVDP